MHLLNKPNFVLMYMRKLSQVIWQILVVVLLTLMQFLILWIIHLFGQSLPERTKLILWKRAFKKFEVIWSASAYHITLQFFLKAVFHKFLLGPFLNTLFHLPVLHVPCWYKSLKKLYFVIYFFYLLFQCLLSASEITS